jgi:uncharacterized membrane protein
MESYINDWLNLLFRWLHLITGAAWIGTSFYFNWLNHNVRPPKEKKKGIQGELFAIHGGHFYQVLKYSGAPEELPKILHWFKWEAYFTWITGICLLAIVYYWNANLYLIDNNVMSLLPWQAILISLGGLTIGWLIYDQMCKSALVKRPKLFALIGFFLIAASSYGFTEVFSPRAAYLHVGAMIGTIMAANVFFVIIPNQQKMVDMMIAGKEPDISLGAAGSLRSFHNNYFTLPALFIMVSNHFPLTYGHQFNWLILLAISLIGASVRHYFNLKHKGQYNTWILPGATVAMLALAFVIRPVTETASIKHNHLASYIEKVMAPLKNEPHQEKLPTKRELDAAIASDSFKSDETTLVMAKLRKVYQDENLDFPKLGVHQKKVTYKDVDSILKERCTTCHSSNPTYPDIDAAPLGVKFDSAQLVVNFSQKIKAMAIDSDTMPPGNVTNITDQERKIIKSWIEAGSPLN